MSNRYHLTQQELGKLEYEHRHTSDNRWALLSMPDFPGVKNTTIEMPNVCFLMIDLKFIT